MSPRSIQRMSPPTIAGPGTSSWRRRWPGRRAFADAGEFCRAVRGRRETSPDSVATMPGSTLATAHSTKGLEFDHVAVVDMDAGRFPSQRSLDDADDPVRALEEERRLAYVAWTRARRSLTLVYDPAAPSPLPA